MKTNSKRFLKGGLAILLAVTMLFGSCISGIAAVVDNAETKANVDIAETSDKAFVAGEYLYFKNSYVYGWNNTLWVVSGMYLWAHLWNDSSSTDIRMDLYSGTANTEGAIYRCKIPSAVTYNYVIFSRSTSSSSNNWSWGQSYNVPLDSAKNTYYNTYGNGNGSETGTTYTASTPATCTATVTNAISGSGTSSDPYLVYAGDSFTVQVKATKDDMGNEGFGYNINSSSSKAANNTTGTWTKAYTASTTVGSTSTYTGYAWCYENSTSYYSTNYKASSAIYVRTVPKGYSYTVTAGTGGTVSPTSGTATSATITATPDTGYEFAGWQTTNGTVDNESSASTTFTPSANGANAHATFTKKTYTVKFTDINGNQIGSTQTVEHGATPTAPTAPTITGKTFTGWNPTVGAVTDDTTYQATYTDNTYSITVNQTGGTGTVTLGKTSAKYGDTVTISVTPPTNYKISSITGGGLNVGECESYNGSFTMPASNVTITVNYVLAGTCAPHFAYGDQELVLGATVTNTASTNEYCDDAPNSTFTYVSSDTTVATVNASTGLVTAKKPGTTTITATCDCGTTATYTVTVKSPSVSVPALTVAVNGTATAQPAITDGPSSGYTITYSDSSDYFNVTANGTVTAVKPGTGTVNFTMTYGGNTVATGSFSVTVSEPTFSILPHTDNLIVGQTMTADFETTSTPAAQSVTLTSADTSKVTISGNKATAVAAAPEGVTITAAFKYNNNYTAYATAKVIVAAPEITADPTSVALELGDGSTNTSNTVTLDTNAAAGNGTGDDITVTTANTNVATATLSGNTLTITATGLGSTTVTAKFHDAEVEIPVTVTKYDPYVYLYVTDSQGWDNMFLHSWKGSNSNVTTLGESNAQMIYIGRNGDNAKVFAYRFLKGTEPEKVIMVKQNSWPSDNLIRTDDYAVDFSKGYAALYIDSSTNSSGRRNTGYWTDDCMIVRPTVSVADVVVPVAQTATATATVENGGVLYWTTADTTKATVADVTTATATVTGVAVGDTTISARAFIDTANSSIKTLPNNYKTDSTSWPFISNEATATVTVGSVDYTVNVNAQYSNDGTNYVDGTTGGTVRATKSAAEGYGELTLPAQISHGKTIEVGATAKSGYRFVGWYKNNNFTTSVGTSTGLATSAITADTTYTARFVKTHQVTVNFTDGIESIKFNNVNYTDSFDNITVDAGADITVYATPAPGYKFADWTVQGATVADNTAVNLTVSNIQSSVTLTANAVPVYTASATATTRYTSTGGSVTVNGQNSPIQVINGETVTFVANPSTTFKFVGWFSDAEFTNLVSTNTTYKEEMTASGINLYALFVKDMVLYDTDTSTKYDLYYDYKTDTYSLTTADLGYNFKVSENYYGNNAINATDVNVIGGTHTGATVTGTKDKYTIVPDLENYDPTKGVNYQLVADGDGTYTMNITLEEADKVDISVNGTKVAEKAVGTTFNYTITPPDGQYLLNVTTTPDVNASITDNTVTFTVPETNVNIVPTFANYSYVEFSNETTGLNITGLKNGYKAGEAVTITVTPTSEQVTISEIVADNDAAVITQNGDNWTVTIASMPADTTITLTTTVDAKFKMDYEMVAIGNYGSGYTTYGTVALNINGTALAKGGYVDKTDTVTYTATAEDNFIFDGWYSDASCSQGSLLTRNTSYDVTPTKDTTLYALFVPKHYIAEDQANVSSHQEMTYDPETRSFKYSTSTIAKDAWFRVSNNPTTSYWTDSSSYCIFDSSFNVTFNANAYMVTVGWGTQCYALTSDSSAEHPYEIIVALNGNSSIDVSCKAAVDGIGSVFLSSGRGDIVEATSIFTTEGITAVDKNAHQDGTDVSIHESYKVANLQEPQTVSFETELTGENAGNYYIDRYVVYHVNTETYTLITPNTLGNNKYSGTVYVDGPCYIVPIYHLTPEYTAANGLVEIDIYFDATAIMDKNWGPFVACYAWGSNNTNYAGGWSGQLMIPTEDGSSFYAMIAVPDGVTNTSSVPNGVTFNNYMQATVPGHNAGAFGISATQYQCYDYREPITLYEEGYDVITFVAKESTDGYHGDRANGVTVNTVTTGTTDIFNKYDFDYLYNRNGDVPMDLNGDDIENPVDISEARADYYIIAKGDITYDPNGTKYVADNQFDADWAVDWYVFDSNGTYITHILSDAMYNKYADDGTTYLENALGLTAAQAAGKTIAISYDHENNAGHQISYDGQWYGNMLDDTIIASAVVGIIDENGEITIDNVDPNNEADYGEGWIVANEELDGIIVGDKYARLPITLDYGAVDLSATVKDGYRFVGWYTYSNNKYSKITAAADYNTYISNDTTYYAIFKEIGDDEVIINHLVYNNPDDPFIPSHGGVSEMLVEVYDSQGNLVNTGSTPSTSISTAAFVPDDNEEYKIIIKTTPLMNGTFFAWYTDSDTVDGTKTYEEILVDDTMIGSETMVQSEFTYVYDVLDPVKVINIYSDVTRVSNYANIFYKYLNRFGEWRTITVRDVPLTDDECMGYAGNGYIPYVPSYITQTIEVDGATKSYNSVQEHAPNAEVTEVFDGVVVWRVEEQYLTPTASNVTVVAYQDTPNYTLTYELADGTIDSVTGKYNTLAEISAPAKDGNGNKFSYWIDTESKDIISYKTNYNYRLVNDRSIKAVYGDDTAPEWSLIIENVEITREYQDKSDYVYTDYLIAYHSKQNIRLDEDPADIRYGLIVLRDNNYVDASYPSQNYADQALLESRVKKVAEKATNMRDSANNTLFYHYDLTDKNITNFNRINYYLQYDNNFTEEVNGKTVYLRDYSYSAYAYLVDADGEIFISKVSDVNFYDEATASVNQ